MGKTSLLQRYVKGKFTSAHKVTIGADFLAKKLEFGGKEYNIQFWDTAGQERFNSLGGGFYRGSDVCVIVFDITDKKVLKNFIFLWGIHWWNLLEF